MEGFPQGDHRRAQPPVDNFRDRPRCNLDNEQYPPYNPYHPHPPPRNPPSYSGYRGEGYQEDQGYRTYLDEQRRQQEQQERERLRLQEEQKRQNNEDRYQRIKPDFKAMRAQISNAHQQCTLLEPSFDKYLKARKVILAPVYENFEENHRKLQDFYFEAQDDLIRFRAYVSLFEGAAKSILFMIRHGLITQQKVVKHLNKSRVDIPVQRGVHGVLIGQMDTLLYECRHAIDRLMRSWAEERAKPKLTQIYEGDVLIELVDDEDSEVLVEQKVVQAVVADEMNEMKREVSEMKIAMNEMKVNMQEMKELLNLAVQQAAIKNTRAHEEAPKPVDFDLVSSQERNEENSSRGGPVFFRNSGNARESEPHREERAQKGQRYRDRSYENENDDRSLYNGREYENRPRSLELDNHDRNFGSSRNDSSPFRSSHPRSDWSPDRYTSSHHNRGSRNGFSGYDSERNGRGQSYEENDFYSGHSQSRHNSNRHSRGPSCDQTAHQHASNEHQPLKKQNSGPSTNQGYRNQKKGDDRCFRCKKPGHHKIQCKEIECNSCGRLGHLASSCTSTKQRGRNF